MTRKRILFTIPNFISAGSGREMVNIIDRLDKGAYEPIVCIQKSGGAIEEELKRNGYMVLVTPFNAERKGILQALLTIFRLAQFFRKFKLSVWHSFNWSSDYSEAIIARLSGAIFVYTKKNMNWSRRAWKIKSVLAHHIVARNQTMLATLFKANRFKQKVTFITGGINHQHFFPNKTSSAFRTKYSISHQVFVITSVAQLISIKGQDIIINAVKDIPQAVVFLAGAERDPEYAARLKKLIQHNEMQERVYFLGSVNDVAALLNESDVFVLATTKENEHEEGCPVSLLEAMACGTPCIASRVAGCVDLIRDEENGLLFEPRNADDLRNKITRIMRDRVFADTLGRQAASDARLNYTLEKEALAFQQVYSGILK